VFVCQHLTPELVWRPEWQRHANGAAELIGAALAAKRPFDGLPASIEWRAVPALRISGLRSRSQAHGVELLAA
jgi:hypothetical protein